MCRCRLRYGVRGRRTQHGHLQLRKIRIPELADRLLLAAVHAGRRALLAGSQVRRHELLPGPAVRARPDIRLRGGLCPVAQAPRVLRRVLVEHVQPQRREHAVSHGPADGRRAVPVAGRPAAGQRRHRGVQRPRAPVREDTRNAHRLARGPDARVLPAPATRLRDSETQPPRHAGRQQAPVDVAVRSAPNAQAVALSARRRPRQSSDRCGGRRLSRVPQPVQPGRCKQV